jgi:hypothetical protein
LGHRSQVTPFDLGQLVCAFAVVVGLASLYVGLRLFARGRSAIFGPGVWASPAPVGVLLALCGVALIFMVGMTLAGPWRNHDQTQIPLRVLDLNIPPAAIERVSPPPSPPPLPDTDTASARNADSKAAPDIRRGTSPDR